MSDDESPVTAVTISLSLSGILFVIPPPRLYPPHYPPNGKFLHGEYDDEG